MRRVTLALGLVVAGVVALAGCASADDDRPTVVVTTNILGDIVENLAGDELDVVTFMPPDADPHSFELSAQDAATMRSADLVVSNGLGLEEGVQHHVDASAADGVAQFVAGDHVETLGYLDSDAVDPHFWTDPTQTARVVDALAPVLAELAGAGGQAVTDAGDAYVAELEAVDAEMAAGLQAIPAEHRALVTNHHVFGYLARRYDVRILGAAVPGGTTLAAPSASDLQELVDAIDAAGVRTIFADSSQPDRLMRVLADEAGRDVAVVPLLTESLAPEGQPGDTYLDMMRQNLQRITDGLTR
ncbi:metal ABC transporter substrate-binding protein [Microbacterium arborescens]|jgi:zinc/manganese transport system substrate-binding protein|uniref:metal ABC transporter substrate-binding protein n=1 Tax=Microbacterium arborescens TaxID=33883 RepID=UPI0025A2396F|nr:metal ABC transporter substrate-binding protein [Microbacterium arborescens]WJM16382.1 metal ABC transporter substrate-binding protein [Microbacterium arborescens]